jgi:hypothetical protein
LEFGDAISEQMAAEACERMMSGEARVRVVIQITQ